MTWLAEPHPKYQASVITGIKEFQAEGRNLYLDIDWIDAHFSAWVTQLHNAKLDQQPDGRVPESFYWIMDEDEYVGRISLRHALNDKLRRFGGHIGYEVRPTRRREGHGKRALTLMLDIARKHNLDKVMLTCDDSNIGSQKIIQANGGVHEDTIMVDGRDIPTMRWWIDLTKPSDNIL